MIAPLFDSIDTPEREPHRLAALFTSRSEEWNTPERLARLIEEFSPIGLDPCSNGKTAVLAKEAWSEDGLRRAWRGHGLVFVNPPYGRSVIAWAERARESFADPQTDECLLLIPARTDTAWFHENCFTADAICFIRKRIEFVGSGKRRGRCPFPSALVYFGARPDAFATHFTQLGAVVVKGTCYLSHEGVEG